MADKTTQFLKGASIQTVITVLMGVMEIVVFAIISRLLSKTDFGYYAAISGIIAIVLSISEAGLGSSVIQKKDASDLFVSTAFTWSCLLGLIASTIVFIFAPLLAGIIADQTLTTPLRVMSITIFLHSMISVGNGILYKKLKFKTVGIIRATSYLFASVTCIIMASLGMGLWAVITLPVINSIMQVTLTSCVIKWPMLKIQRSETKEIVSFGGWLTLGVILNNLTHQLDKLLLPKWMSVATLGAYNRPAGFISTISDKLNGIFDTVLFPMLSDMQDDKTRVNNVFKMSISLLNSFSIILAAIFYFNAHLIISIFFGENWLELVPVMRVISISVIFNVNGRLVDCFFRSLAYVKLGFFLRALAAIITFICIYIGSSHGILSVATAIVIANITNILVKLCALAIKTDTSIFDVGVRMIRAWYPVIPILPIGIPFLIINSQSWYDNICFAILFFVIIVVEFSYFPKFVGETYLSRVYPMVEKVKKKIFLKLQLIWPQ